MILSGHQPNYLPYPGLIGKILFSDKFIYVSDVQIEKKSWQNRNRIKGSNGELLLTVPILTKGKYEQKISETKIENNSEWKRKHFQAIMLNYKKAPYYACYIDFFEDLYKREWEYLNDLDIYITNWILSEMNCKTEIYYDTDFSFNGKKNGLLLEMCKELECDTYLSNKGSENYVDISCFTQEGLNHKYLDFICPKYYQGKGEFIENLSIIDFMFRLGSEKTKLLIEDVENYRFSEINKTIRESMGNIV